MSRQHELKVSSEYFAGLWDKTKTFEIRNNDRAFQKGDTVLLRETDGIYYTHRNVEAIITYVFSNAKGLSPLADGYVVLGLQNIKRTKL